MIVIIRIKVRGIAVNKFSRSNRQRHRSVKAGSYPKTSISSTHSYDKAGLRKERVLKISCALVSSSVANVPSHQPCRYCSRLVSIHPSLPLWSSPCTFPYSVCDTTLVAGAGLRSARSLLGRVLFILARGSLLHMIS